MQVLFVLCCDVRHNLMDSTTLQDCFLYYIIFSEVIIKYRRLMLRTVASHFILLRVNILRTKLQTEEKISCMNSDVNDIWEKQLETDKWGWRRMAKQSGLENTDKKPPTLCKREKVKKIK